MKRDREKLLVSLEDLIVSDARRRKEKIIAISYETFEEVKGKEVRIKLTSGLIEKMEKDLEEYDNTRTN
ncbi:MAG: hypothetical protein E7A85_00075 [Anaerococcus sp.]|jgi:hypothetical protein|nr:hypothetical protein [Anaerococcus sp.]DAU83003.1 MAG TPA: hypothetical protein [Caudoviricetes sp.]